MGPLRTRCGFAGLLALAATLAPPVHAQSGHPLSIQLSGLYQSMSGANAEQIPSGPGAELQVRYTFSSWSLGVGVDYTKHSPDYGGEVSFYGGFIEPRYVFDLKSDRLAPYLSARVGFAAGRSRYSYTDSASFYSQRADISGTTLNAGGGVLVKLVPGVNLDIGATLGSTQFSGGNGSDSATGSGTNSYRVDPSSLEDIIVRFGLSIGLRGSAKRVVAPEVHRP